VDAMKSAYELAMERLNKTEPTVKLTSAQKKQLAELDSLLSARIAEREIGLKSEIEKSQGQGDYEEVSKLQKQLAHERKAIQAEFEEKKEQVRKGGKK
jgi:hypothetical protein